MLDGLVTAVVGGYLVFFGPIIGSGFLTAVPEIQKALGLEAGWVHPLITGLLLLTVIVFLPGGLSTLFARVRRRPRPVGADEGAFADQPPLPAPGTTIARLRGVEKRYGAV